jgi:glycine/serine hydroxymethyltransferase
MTRFGMQAEDFQTLAQLMADVILHAGSAKDNVVAL